MTFVDIYLLILGFSAAATLLTFSHVCADGKWVLFWFWMINSVLAYLAAITHL